MVCSQVSASHRPPGLAIHWLSHLGRESAAAKEVAMDQTETHAVTRRAFAGAAAFMIVPRHVLGAPFIPPSDRITLATIGLGRQGQAVTMNLLARPDVQVTAVCDCNRGSKDYVEY